MEHVGVFVLIGLFMYAFRLARKEVLNSRLVVQEKKRIECEMAPRFIRISTELYREKRKPAHHVNLSKMQALTEELDRSVELYQQNIDNAARAEDNCNVHNLRVI